MRAIGSFGLSARGLRAALVLSLLAAGSQGAIARDGTNAALLGGLAGGVLGGVAAGAIIGAQPAPPPPVYRPRPVYVEEQPEVIVRRPREPICHYERRKVWLDDQEFTFRRVEICE